MATDGDVCKATFLRAGNPLVAKVIELDIPTFSGKECCIKIPALADAASDDEFKNDFFVAEFNYDLGMTDTVVMKLQEEVAGVWTDIATLIDDTYGTYYPYGSLPFKDLSRSFVAYKLDWKTILGLEGEGKYRVEVTATDILGNDDVDTTFEFCLQQYTDQRANETTRFTWYLDGLMGDDFDDQLVLDYRNPAEFLGGDGWVHQMRFPTCLFGRNKSEYQSDYIRYPNGQQVYIEDTQVESYEWTTGRYDFPLHNFIKTNLLQADRILVTDYNKLNSNNIVNKAVKRSGNYEPEYVVNSLKSRAKVTFNQEFQNRRKLRC